MQRTVFVGSTVAVAIAAALVFTFWQAPSAAAYEPEFESAECWFALPDSQPVECGYLIVPEDRADPDSPDIRIAVAILRHPGGNPEPDPILRLHGGPGGGYLPYMSVAWTDDATLFAANRDIIAFDQRGQGLSEPSLNCPEIQRSYFDALDYEIDGERVDADGFLDYMASQVGVCYERLSADHNLSTYNSLAIAADAADLMLALGYDTYNIHAGSYGVTAALFTMRDHPEGIRSVILDAPRGLVEPEAEHFIAFRDAFDEALDTCAADAECNAAFPDLRQTWLDALAQLEADPPIIEAVDGVTGERYGVFLNAANAITPLRLSLASPGATRMVPLYIRSAAEGNFDLIAQGWGDATRRFGTFVGWGAWLSVRCAEPVTDADNEALKQLIGDTPTLGDMFDHGAFGGAHRLRACENWPVDALSEDDLAPVESDIPTLMIVGQIDAATDFALANETAEHLPDVYGMYVFPALGHIVGLGSHDCPTAIEAAFLADPSVEPDTGCIDDMPPVAFATELGGGAFTLADYAGEGFTGVAPNGWNELQPGFFARSDPSVDKTLFVQLAAPAAQADEMMAGVLGEFGLTSLPDEPMRRIPAGDLAWEIYVPAGVVPMIVAKAETESATYLAVLIASQAELDGLVEALLLPAIQRFEPGI